MITVAGAWTLRGLKEAVDELKHQKKVLEQLEQNFPKETISTWLQMLRQWEMNPGNSPNPFHEEERKLNKGNQSKHHAELHRIHHPGCARWWPRSP